MAWFGNNIGGHMAQSIINGTDKLTIEPRKTYVYLVYDECHGFRGVFGSVERAKAEVEHISIVEYGMRTDEEIWAEYGERGNELCYYREEEVIS